MHIPSPFREDDPEVIAALIRAHPLASLVGVAAGDILATPLPFLFDPQANVLRGHMARPNAFWQSFDRDRDVMAIFHGPDHYISPSWYPSKSEHGRVVPTWNYVEVHVFGRLTVHEGTDWLRPHLDALTAAHERAMPSPWKSSNAPPEFLLASMKAIVGVELAISKIEGKWKVSQNRIEPDREGAARGLEGLGTCSSQRMAELVRERLQTSPAPPSTPTHIEQVSTSFKT